MARGFNWEQHKRHNPDYIKNCPSVTKCSGKFIRTINGKTKVFNCQLRWDHESLCICYSGRKQWEKGTKVVKWDQMEMNLPTTLHTEPVVSEAVSKVLSLLDPDTKP